MKKNILVVDDDRVMLKFISKLLAREGHEVVTAEDGFAALNLLSSFTPDIMFFDLIMPKIDGSKLIQIVRSMPQMNNCYLVIISAAMAEVDFDFEETGAVPTDTEDLVNMTLSVAGSEVAFILVEQQTGGFKISFRSRCATDCSRLAEHFGGGGHKAAAGAFIQETPEVALAQVLDAVRSAMR